MDVRLVNNLAAPIPSTAVAIAQQTVHFIINWSKGNLCQ